MCVCVCVCVCATTSKVPFLKLAATELVSSLSGESEAKIRALFTSAMVCVCVRVCVCVCMYMCVCVYVCVLLRGLVFGKLGRVLCVWWDVCERKSWK